MEKTIATIDKSNIADVFPMNDIQKGMVLLSIMNPEAAMYHDQFVYFVPPIDRQDDFIHAVKLMMEKHPVLRTGFELDNFSEEVQIVYKEVEPWVQFTDLTKNTIAEQEQYIHDYMVKERFKVYDFKTPPLWRINIFALNEENSAYLIQFHHAILDGWSLASLNTELFNTYAQLKDNKNYKPAPLKAFFKDLVIEELAEKNNEVSISYWKEKLKDFNRLDVFHTDRVDSRHLRASLGMEKSLRMKEQAAKDGLAYKNVIFGAFAYVFNMLALEDDFVMGVVSNNRPAIEDGDKVLGCFLNTLPLRLQFDKVKELSWIEYFQHIEAQMLELKVRDRSTLLEITKITGQRAGAENPFFDIIFNHIDFQNVYRELTGAKSQFQQKKGIKTRNHEMSNTYLDVNFIDVRNGEMLMEYLATRAFKADITLEQFQEYFMNVLDCYLENPHQKVNTSQVIPAAERERLLHGFNDTEKAFDLSLSAIDLFRQQAAQHPEKEALAVKGKVYTYRELDALSNRFANYLETQGKINRNELVGLKIPRSEWVVIAILAIWKSGGAYVPIDPNYPEHRTAYMERDSNARIIVNADMIAQFTQTQDQYAATYQPSSTAPDSLAYMIYTSGSTGQPKGVKIGHTALSNFIHAMNDALQLGTSDHLLALTTISFDISILELFWTLCNGIKITIEKDNTELYGFDRWLQGNPKMDFSLFYFASQNFNEEDKYKLLLDSAKYGDENGFSALWLPERHFHEFGGIFPNPSLLASAIAATTKNIRIHAGSVVLPLHDTIRVAEEWSVVDNLSKGRVALAIASGWHADDFVFKPDHFKNRREVMYQQIQELKQLWKGKPVKRINGAGKEVELNIFPKPIQQDLPIWITSAGSADTFRSAGRIGANLLTHMLGQDINVLEENIKAYKEELTLNGYDVQQASVTLMLHVYIGDDMETVKRTVKEPFKNYLRSSIGLLKNLLAGIGKASNIEENELEDLLEMVFERYWNTSALFGTKESCGRMLRRLYQAGVTEIGCLIDFGIENDKVMAGLAMLNELKDEFKGGGINQDQHITAMQITPSYLGALTEDNDSARFLQSLKHLIVGGEYFPEKLKKKILDTTTARVYNMYGPTETTIWSASTRVETEKGNVIGKPIANTQIYILNKDLQLCPIGVKGQLFIGGKGLSMGYHQQAAATAAKFIEAPFNKAVKIYNTGDLARWLPDGTIEFFGRTDSQVKIRGHRIELGEIEHQLAQIPGIDAAVVIDRETGLGQKELAAYIVAAEKLKPADLRAYLSAKLPAIMVPAYFIQVDEMPLTANGKVNRKALAALEHDQEQPDLDYVAPRNRTEEELAEIWKTILNRKQVGVKDSFFDIGGNSLNVVRLRRILKKDMGVSISIVDLFKYTTIESIARVINKERDAAESVEENVEVLKF
ncbi:MupA/Atu3671 family FMN-dependent luciferase-like monooxygenase [uncultured Chitinophaga sp.]|jgi:natural product biosynthesis luciferase-like monooxygenase domain|uniref:MupA/Atu3671 family FMN-dependent luciferase-like monooxygenase n=1 Tax=uncultured Chitinophaga sp. TaxID=339340 RepID=UPI002605885B|nr:MupA/Atu3671 family FMN-dependent luciferase-like monooxygenase [uncultured Chitinophaga sp.]